MSTSQFYRGKIVKVLNEGTTTDRGEPSPYQNLLVEITEADGHKSSITVNHGQIYTISESDKLQSGASVIVSKSDGPTGSVFNIYDADRSTPLLLLFGLFVGVVLLTTRRKGVGALIGLGVTILILMYMIVPLVIHGYNPALVSLAGSVLIASISLFFAHGFQRSTIISLGATLITLLFATGLAQLSIAFLHMTGGAQEETLFLSMSGFGELDLRGLLLGGMIIGTLGVLDDVVTSQVAAVGELKKTNASLTKKQLISHALTIGREHILAVVNTLLLAYAAGALPLFIIFTASTEIPLWVLINNEVVVEEIIRTLVGSIALIAAVPLSTLLAVQFHKIKK